MKGGPISELLITKTGHRPTQYKKITNTVPVLCVDKNFWNLNEVIWTEHNLVERDLMPTYPDATQWSNTHHVEIQTVDQSVAVDANTGLCPPFVTLLLKTHVFDTNL